MEDFSAALLAFVDAAQVKVNERFADGQHGFGEKLRVQVGPKYVRVFIVSTRNGEQTSDNGSAFCFVEVATGNVLKAASWKAPAKGIRSNIYSADHGASGVTGYGAVYHR